MSGSRFLDHAVNKYRHIDGTMLSQKLTGFRVKLVLDLPRNRLKTKSLISVYPFSSSGQISRIGTRQFF